MYSFSRLRSYSVILLKNTNFYISCTFYLLHFSPTNLPHDILLQLLYFFISIPLSPLISIARFYRFSPSYLTLLMLLNHFNQSTFFPSFSSSSSLSLTLPLSLTVILFHSFPLDTNHFSPLIFFKSSPSFICLHSLYPLDRYLSLPAKSSHSLPSLYLSLLDLDIEMGISLYFYFSHPSVLLPPSISLPLVTSSFSLTHSPIPRSYVSTIFFHPLFHIRPISRSITITFSRSHNLHFLLVVTI